MKATERAENGEKSAYYLVFQLGYIREASKPARLHCSRE